MSGVGGDRGEARGSVPNVFVRALFEYLGQKGIDAPAILDETAPESGDLGERRYPIARWRDLLERASTALDDPLLGLHLGESLSARHGGTLSYLLLSCRTVGDVFEHYARYERLFYDASLVHYRSDERSTFVEWSERRGKPGPLVDECAISAFARFVRGIVRDPVPLEEVHFENRAPADTGPYERVFGCVVRFEQPTTLLRWPIRLLETPLRSADPLLLRVMEEHADALLVDRPTGNELERRVRRVIARRIRENREPTLERVAAEIGMSSRTMRRRLDEREKSFRSLLDETRRRMAEQLLADPRLDLSEIAQRIGFSEQSAFNRSFKRWTGETPRRFREKSRARSSSQGHGRPRRS